MYACATLRSADQPNSPEWDRRHTVFLAMTAAHAYTAGVLNGAFVVWAVGPFALALCAFRNQEIWTCAALLL